MNSRTPSRSDGRKYHAGGVINRENAGGPAQHKEQPEDSDDGFALEGPAPALLVARELREQHAERDLVTKPEARHRQGSIEGDYVVFGVLLLLLLFLGYVAAGVRLNTTVG